MKHEEIKSCNNYENGDCKIFFDQDERYWRCDEVEKNGKCGTCVGWNTTLGKL